MYLRTPSCVQELGFEPRLPDAPAHLLPHQAILPGLLTHTGTGHWLQMASSSTTASHMGLDPNLIFSCFVNMEALHFRYRTINCYTYLKKN